MRAAYSERDDALRWIGPAAATLMACPVELMEQDQWLGAGSRRDGRSRTTGPTDLVLESDGVSTSFEEFQGDASSSP